jgi:hypothetical protein
VDGISSWVILRLSEGKSSAEDDGLSIGESHSQRLEGSFKLFRMVLVGQLVDENRFKYWLRRVQIVEATRK